MYKIIVCIAATARAYKLTLEDFLEIHPELEDFIYSSDCTYEKDNMTVFIQELR